MKGEQLHRQVEETQVEEEPVAATTTSPEAETPTVADIDAILAEIDLALEDNSLGVVANFQQRGGQ